jgi:hypothetical protein
VSTWIFHPDIAGSRLLGPYFLPSRQTGAFIRISYEMSFQRCCKKWIGRLGFMYDGAPRHFLLAVRELLNDVFPEKIDMTKWTKSMASFFP